MTPSDLRRVDLEGAPVHLWRDVRSWFEELLREFAIIAVTDPEHSTPTELIAFVAAVRDRFGEGSLQSDAQLDQALAAGLSEADAVLWLPATAAPAARRMWEMIIRADDYCRRGQLLTLQLTADQRRFLEWYLLQVADQLEGSEPTRWPR